MKLNSSQAQNQCRQTQLLKTVEKANKEAVEVTPAGDAETKVSELREQHKGRLSTEKVEGRATQKKQKRCRADQFC